MLKSNLTKIVKINLLVSFTIWGVWSYWSWCFTWKDSITTMEIKFFFDINPSRDCILRSRWAKKKYERIQGDKKSKKTTLIKQNETQRVIMKSLNNQGIKPNKNPHILLRFLKPSKHLVVPLQPNTPVTLQKSPQSTKNDPSQVEYKVSCISTLLHNTLVLHTLWKTAKRLCWIMNWKWWQWARFDIQLTNTSNTSHDKYTFILIR